MMEGSEQSKETPSPRDLSAQMREDLEAIGRTFMPFGKYGPGNHPPNGVPLYDLPAEYLGWFAAKGGWPRGRLGELMQMVYQMKVDGSDPAFDPFRARAGGRTRLRPTRQTLREWNFDR